MNLREFCRVGDLQLSGSQIQVSFLDGRYQNVQVVLGEHEILLRSTAATRSHVSKMKDPGMSTWERNQSSSLVTFRIDKRSRLIGESWIPIPGLSAAEFRTYVRNLARECDRFEFLLTGKDVH